LDAGSDGVVRKGAAFAFVALLALAVVPVTAPTAQAADVSATLIAKNSVWHLGTETSAETNIVVNVGDTLRLRVENHDFFLHTFTAPRFEEEPGQGGQGPFLNASLPFEGTIFFWNHTVAADQAGSWQYYCIPHSAGAYPDRFGMVGLLVFVAPGPTVDPFLLAFAVGLVAVVAITAFWVFRRRKRP